MSDAPEARPADLPADLPTLRTVTRTSGANAALKDGSVAPDGFAFDFVEVPVLVQAFRRMVRTLEFDCTEMAVTTYLTAKEHGVAFTALPVFLVRGFHQGAIQVLAGSGITDPAQLAGTRVGVNRGYTVTTGVWARSVLAVEHGLDLSSVTWVLSGDEHVESYRPPANVEPAPAGQSLEDLLRAGDLAAVVGADISAPDVVPLLPEPDEAAVAALRSRGTYPINHLVVVRDDLLAARPELAAQVFDAFARAKQPYLAALRSDGFVPGDALDRTCARVLAETGEDPLPYGLEPNRAVLTELMGHALDQGILRDRVPLEDLFAPGTHDLVG
jgi:ABC-type amino acid transport substrate-binding protein